MPDQQAPPLPERIYAQASPRSIGGTSLFDPEAVIQSDTVHRFASEASVVQEAAARLRDAGFEVLQVTPLTINVAGPPEAFQRTFGAELVTREREIRNSGRPDDLVTFIDDASTNRQGFVETRDSDLGRVLEGVAIEEPALLFENAFPPRTGYWHLNVPGGVSLALNADAAHRRGVTGRGVHVCMVDSGWYRHPYFQRRRYRAAPVVLSPGASDPATDPIGHGTGESANAFAAAPDITFTMVKTNFVNTTAAFNAAVALRPHAISCSWGSDTPDGPLSAAQQALAAAVAAAVASGIIVVFSAGNGHWSFPGQHPDVIAAGGVYMGPDGSLTASDYASGFPSRIYPGRNVPDVCGLVGMLPKAIYLMLPVEAGDQLDVENAGGRFPDGDETASDDGWAAFSGTSAAAPQVAGVCALMKQAYPDLGPGLARTILQRTARDVTTGHSNPNTPGVAGPGPDSATGAGLVDAQRAVLLATFYNSVVHPPPTAPPVPRPRLPRQPERIPPIVIGPGDPAQSTAGMATTPDVDLAELDELIGIQHDGGQDA